MRTTNSNGKILRILRRSLGEKDRLFRSKYYKQIQILSLNDVVNQKRRFLWDSSNKICKIIES